MTLVKSGAYFGSLAGSDGLSGGVLSRLSRLSQWRGGIGL